MQEESKGLRPLGGCIASLALLESGLYPLSSGRNVPRCGF